MKKNFPLISVIIPVYNVEKFLSQCVESILVQTYSNYEVILVNDGSKDNSLDICNELSLKDKRIKTINQENQGAGAARNAGLEAANGEYIYFLDADDFIEPELFEKTIGSITEYEFDIILFSFNKIALNGKKISTITHKEYTITDLQQNKELLADLFLDGGCFAVWDKLIRKDFLMNNNIVFDKTKRVEDMIFMIKCYERATSLKSIPNVLHNYRVAYNVASKYSPNIVDDLTKVFASLFTLLENKKDGKLNSNSNIALKRTFVLWFGIVIPINIVNNKELSLYKKKSYLNELYSQKQFQEWLDYLRDVKASRKNEFLFKLTRSKNMLAIIPFMKTISYLREKLHLTF